MKIKILKINKQYSNKYEFLQDVIMNRLNLNKTIFEKIVEREKLSPTLLEYEIAMPHIVLEKSPEQIFLIINEHPVYWGVRHAESVKKIFLIIAGDRERLKYFISKLAMFINEKRGKIDEKSIETFEI